MSQFINKHTSTDNNVLTIKTVQIAPFRTLMIALKDILLETNISFQTLNHQVIQFMSKYPTQNVQIRTRSLCFTNK